MKVASADDKMVTIGFLWYMIQDFKYCANLMLFDTERSKKATTSAIYEELAAKIGRDAGYAVDMLKTCTDPSTLNIPDWVVLGAGSEDAVTNYSSFQVNTAKCITGSVG
ncbi:hypothetical protein SERLADRAFT_380552 [Serpula lacrymans var. lacrymans S7.9]|nr:uncharacterized protein SERLADRAFT_380552 [Serpula lacrymans var. lacrymans S7.9]EGO28625.1 hypothetical protein SERLADRAFT_380552 [Serpula lacrymans var. lacrymans S7.9]